MIYAIFPMLAALCYGMAFAFTEKAMQSVNVATYMFWVAVVEMVFALGLMRFKGEDFTFQFTQNKTDFFLVGVAVLTPALGWIFTTYAIKNTSASYAAFAEISYPIFTVLILMVFFGLRTLDWTVLVGGLMIMVGSFIMLSGPILKE